VEEEEDESFVQERQRLQWKESEREEKGSIHGK